MMVTKLFSSKRAQASAPSNSSGAAFLILLIAVLFILYILFLPPQDRDALLQDGSVPGTPNTPSGGYSHLIGSMPLNQQVGQIDYVRDSVITHELSGFTIYTQTDARLITSMNSLYVKNSAFDKKAVELPFSIDKSATNNVHLSFNVFRPSGTLHIYFNGELLFEGKLNEGTPSPIAISQSMLKNNNIIYFTVSKPGFAFWKLNQYELRNVMLTGDITDDSNNFNMQKVYLAQSEYKHMTDATISFKPDCSYDDVGKISLSLNGKRIYYGVPDCGLMNFVDVGKGTLVQGENKLDFTSEKGSYLVDQLKVDVKLEDPQYPIYYFDLNEDLFTSASDSQNWCGKVDGICPANCEPYDDKDCCFDDSINNYWCDFRTNNPRDRCVNMVLADETSNCPSAYEDRNGNPHESVVGKCGDDTDNFCPSGCSSNYDKDCCFEQNDSFWCDDVPFTGQDAICTSTVTPADCGACTTYYHNAEGERPNCPAIDPVLTSGEGELKAGVDVVLKVYFTDDTFKRVDFNINGVKIPVDTYSTSIIRNIDPYIREGTNSIVIQPRKDLAIASMKVTIE